MRVYSYTFHHECHSHFFRYSVNSLHFIRIQRQINIIHQPASKYTCFLVQSGIIDLPICPTSFVCFITYLCSYYIAREHSLDFGEQSLLACFEQRLPRSKKIWSGQVMAGCHPEIIVRILRSYTVDPCCIHFLRLSTYIQARKFNVKASYWWIAVEMEIHQFVNQALQSCHDQRRRLAYHRNSKRTQAKWRTHDFTPTRDQPNVSYCSSLSYLHYSHYGHHIMGGGDTNGLNLFHRRLKRFITRRFGIITRFQFKEQIQWGPWHGVKRVHTYSCNAASGAINMAVLLSSPFIVFMYPRIFVYTKLKGVYVSKLTGMPRSKLDWVRLNDAQIISFFRSMYIHYQLLYGGAANHRALKRYLAYILRYACAKTLAVKHKRSVRFMLDRVVAKSLFFQSVLPERQWYITWIGQDHSLEVSGFEPLASALQGRRSTN